MDINIDKHFDFFLYETEAETIEAEAEEIKAFLAGSCSYLNSKQRAGIERAAKPLFEKLHQAATAARTEANRRKANIENATDPEIKQILELFYIKGLKLERIADILYCDRTTLSKKIKKYCNRYLDKG